MRPDDLRHDNLRHDDRTACADYVTGDTCQDLQGQREWLVHGSDSYTGDDVDRTVTLRYVASPIESNLFHYLDFSDRLRGLCFRLRNT
jgi:hypothetical protein